MAGSPKGVGVAQPSRRYTTYLTIVALAGWTLTSYDMNLLVLTIPDILALTHVQPIDRHGGRAV